MLLSITKLCFSHEMGNCCFMPLDDDAQSETHEQLFNHREKVNNDGFDKWPFTEFFLSDITMATKNFSSDKIISENPEKCPNIVYKACLKDNLGFVAVKRFKNTPWPDPEGFAADAEEVSELKHKRLVKLLGYCCEEDERLLVAEFMPNDTLAKRLFHHQNNQPMEWSMRLRVAYHLVEALEYCNSKCFVSYINLTTYSVLFDKDGDACLSSFGFVREVLYNEGRGGRVNPDSVTHRFGTILLNLLTGMPISPSHAPEVIKEKDVTKLMDPNLKGKFSTTEATKIFEIASECLQWRNIMSFITKDLVITLKTLQAKSIPYTEIAKQQEGASSSQQQQIALSGKQKNPLIFPSSSASLAIPEVRSMKGASSSQQKQISPSGRERNPLFFISSSLVHLQTSMNRSSRDRLLSPFRSSHLQIQQKQRAPLQTTSEETSSSSQQHQTEPLQQVQSSQSGKTKQQEEALFLSQQKQCGSLETIPEGEAFPSQLSPLGRACSRMDLGGIHDILAIAEYEDEKKDIKDISEDGANQVQELGDKAFKEKDFGFAIHCYSEIIEKKKMVSPTVYLRRCLSYLFHNQTEGARLDVMFAKEMSPDSPIVLYLDYVVLSKLNMDKESTISFNKAILLEEERSSSMVKEEKS